MKTPLLVSFVVLASACATIVKSGPDRIPVNSEPEGARVFLDGSPVGFTPMVLTVNRKDECVIEIKKDGYHAIRIDRDKELNGWFFGNLLIGGVIGLGIDLITSNQGKYDTAPVYAPLSPANDKGPKPASLP